MPEPTALDELLRYAAERRLLRDRLAKEERHDTDALVDVVRHGPALEALYGRPLDRRELEDSLGVSRATSHRTTRWLTERGLAVRRDGRFSLTGKGEVFADELLRLDRNLRAAERLAPLLDCICETHREFVVEPFADATVTKATPGDPYAPVSRFLALLDDSETFRGFNTTHVVPPGSPAFAEGVFEEGDAEFVTVPAVADHVLDGETAAAVERGHLRLRTRETLPYGLAIFDDRVGVGGYDDETGTLRVFVDTGGDDARRWAERVYEMYREASEPVTPRREGEGEKEGEVPR
jgi:predicted transcriptional regulator